jgi:hypothetical protein
MKWSDVKEITEAIKNIATLVFYTIIVVFFIIAIWPRIKDFEVKKVSVAGVELGPKERAAIKEIEKIPTNVSKAKDTLQIPLKLIAAAKLIDTTINLSNQHWVYIGQIINGQLTNTHFKITQLPQPGDIITARDAVYKRKDFPIELKNGSWKLGDIRGVVAGDESVKVNVLKEIPVRNYWALVQ